MTSQLWQAAKLATVGELAASIAHELNNPMATINMHVESLMERVGESDPQWRPLKVVEEEIDRMSRLVANLLEFSRRGQCEKSTLNICEEVERSLELVHYHLRKQGILMVSEFSESLPYILVDRQQLRQVFLNLFNNACDAMPEGGTLTIRLTTEQLTNGTSTSDENELADESDAYVCIDISDTGVGMAPEELPRAMEPFYTTKPAGKGTGLGLAICRRIISDHRGKLDLTSEVCIGTRVRVYLPIQTRCDATDQLEESTDE